MRVVCVNDASWETPDPRYKGGWIHPKYNEIYKVTETYESRGNQYHVLDGFPGRGYNSEWFRPLDSVFGEVVCQTIEEQIVYHETIGV